MIFDAEHFLKTVPTQPGVYRMVDNHQAIIYVGKAKNLRNRLGSYFRNKVLSSKVEMLVSKIANVEYTVTHTEKEALLLEHTLIKQHRPRYNILLRDDKTYPYLYLSEGVFPSLRTYRGVKKAHGQYFGPYASVVAMRDSLQTIQKLFNIRSCKESYFRNRSRPCLEYQIKRCKAPCVGLVSKQEYAEDIENTTLFLAGKSQKVIQQLVAKMEQAATNMEYEKASYYRDLIANIKQVQEQQHVVNGKGDADVIAVAGRGVSFALCYMRIRQGQLLGSKIIFPKINLITHAEEVLSAFMTQYYLGEKQIPKTILLSHEAEDREVLQQALSEQAEHGVQLMLPQRGERLAWLKLAITNAEQGLQTQLVEQDQQQQRWQALQAILELQHMPSRLECFDISHSQGEATVASCVVFDQQGPLKSDYRRYNVKGVTASDDYAALRFAIEKRYKSMKNNDKKFPDVVIIDGGKGQLKQAIEVFDELSIEGVILLGIAKGVTRKAGLETVWLVGQQQPLDFNQYSHALHLLQQIRDEAHRFAITGHRKQRQKARNVSILQDIEGIGPKRRRDLLQYFGGMQALQQAQAEDIAKVPGISFSLAERIYELLH